MVVIRSEQMEVFAKQAAQGFEDQTVEYLARFVPKHSRLLGEEIIRRIVREGWARARDYGFTSERGVRLYVSLNFMLGSHFDVDPQLPWAEEILRDEKIATRGARADRLYLKARDYLVQATGERSEHLDEALRRLCDEEDLGAPATSPRTAADFDAAVLWQLRRIFPQKYETVGELNLRRMIQGGVEAAQAHGIADGRGQLVFILMMYMLGSGFHRDLQFPWAAEVLKDDSLTEPKARGARLYTVGIDQLRRWLDED
jgi:hypothetical protein